MKCFDFRNKALIHFFEMDEETFLFSALSLENLKLRDDIADILILKIIRLARKRFHQIVYQFYFCGQLKRFGGEFPVLGFDFIFIFFLFQQRQNFFFF
ncbi:hypothetical protein D3C86_1322290 [compost metagenome]